MTRLQCRHSRRARVHPRMGRDCGYVRISGPLAGDVRSAQVRCAGVNVSSYERLRAHQVAFGRVWSRLVAFSRAIFLFSCPGRFGRVLSHLVISCRILSSFFVISRHFSSFFVPKSFFSGMAGNGRLRHWLGREGSFMLRMVPAPGAGCASCHDSHFKLVCNCGRAAAALVSCCETIVLQNRGVCSSWESRGHLSMGGFWLALKGQDSQQLSGLQFMQLMQFG